MENTEVKKNKEFVAKKSFIQLIKFAIVGVSNTLIDILVSTLLFVLFGKPSKKLLTIGFNAIGYACGLLNSFILNTKWTFSEEYKKTTAEIIKFVVVNLVSYALGTALLLIFQSYLFNNIGLTNWLCSLAGFVSFDKMVFILSKVSSAAIVIIVNFVGSKLFVFTEK